MKLVGERLLPGTGLMMDTGKGLIGHLTSSSPVAPPAPEPTTGDAG